MEPSPFAPYYRKTTGSAAQNAKRERRLHQHYPNQILLKLQVIKDIWQQDLLYQISVPLLLSRGIYDQKSGD